ncbi:helix-turn-helix transcriptional regulator [Deinococcus aluminii]|uniref:HTH cro/C1-type domain-containing protein n=1 Tax=Deinococcus aluminii TaxID=1656885 RepID=A0ABP9XKJ1_9DEIO
MSTVRWRLADFLEERGFTAYALAKASDISRMNTIYRIARRGQEPTRVDLPTLATVLDGLRKLTGEPVDLTDVLEYLPGNPPEAQK